MPNTDDGDYLSTRNVVVKPLSSVGPMSPQEMTWTMVYTKTIQKQSSEEQSLESPSSPSYYSQSFCYVEEPKGG